MKEKVHEDYTKVAKSPLLIYYAKWNDRILQIRLWQNERQQSMNDFWICIVGNLGGDWLRPFLNEVLAVFMGQGESDTLPATFWKWVSTERQLDLALHVG